MLILLLCIVFKMEWSLPLSLVGVEVMKTSAPDLHCSLGIYVPPTANFPKHFHNMGIRIEVSCCPVVYRQRLIPDPQDEVLVGAKNATILSVSAPKEVNNGPFFFTTVVNVFLYKIADIEGACQGLLGLEPYWLQLHYVMDVSMTFWE